MNSMKRQNDRILKGELPRLIGAQYATGDKWRNNSRKNEGKERKQKQNPVVDGTGDRSKIWCNKEQYCIETWKVRSMKVKVKVKSLSRVWLFVTLWMVAYQAPPSMGFSRPEYWSGGAIAFSVFSHLSHPKLGIVFALAPSLHSFWSYFSTDLQ